MLLTSRDLTDCETKRKVGSIFRSSKHEEKVGVQSLDFKYKHRQEESWLVWFREERQILCVCVGWGGVESRWKGSEDRRW